MVCSWALVRQIARNQQKSRSNLSNSIPFLNPIQKQLEKNLLSVTQQLESKTNEFEELLALEMTTGPMMLPNAIISDGPNDLIRLKIVEELELPHKQHLAMLQMESMNVSDIWLALGARKISKPIFWTPKRTWTPKNEVATTGARKPDVSYTCISRSLNMRRLLGDGGYQLSGNQRISIPNEAFVCTDWYSLMGVI